jgi:hypothetical protein
MTRKLDPFQPHFACQTPGFLLQWNYFAIYEDFK